MKTIALTTAALLVAAGSAFAGSDSFRSTANQPATSVDSTYTSSVNSSATQGVFVNHATTDTAAQDHSTHWGNN
jgi:hypothetical protein